jgi:HrpA-like RNA helicase
LLNAIGSDNNVTHLGLEMSSFPIEPKFAKVLIISVFIGIKDDVITLLALMSTENVWQK